MIDVFISRPTWVHPQFRNGLNGLLGLLETLDFKPHTLGATEYPTKAPIDEVIEIMDRCAGAIILGYPQIEIRKGRIKDKDINSSLLLATEWNHIEAGLARARGLPLLVIHHLGITRGIFDRGATNRFIYERDLARSDWPLHPEISGALRKWKQEVVKGTNETPSGVVSNAPICPNCSTATKKLYMSLIPTDFQDIEGATHECTRCHYKAKKQ